LIWLCINVLISRYSFLPFIVFLFFRPQFDVFIFLSGSEKGVSLVTVSIDLIANCPPMCCLIGRLSTVQWTFLIIVLYFLFFCCLCFFTPLFGSVFGIFHKCVFYCLIANPIFLDEPFAQPAQSHCSMCNRNICPACQYESSSICSEVVSQSRPKRCEMINI